MQCVILTAGKGTRMLPITLNTPKPLIPILGKPILGHIIDSLPSAIDELIIVVGYKAEKIKEYINENYPDRSVVFVEQTETLGTGHALSLCKDVLEGNFLVMPGDDLHGKKALEEIVTTSTGLVVSTSEHPERFGVVVTNEDGTVKEILEKPTNPPSNVVSTGVMVLTKDVFSYPQHRQPNGEYYLTEAFTEYAKTHPVTTVLQSTWIPLGYPEDILKAEVQLRLES